MKANPVSPLTEWPSGEARSVAMIRRSPAELERSLGIRFETGKDDLDTFQFALVGEQVADKVLLLQYANAPAEQTEIFVDSRLPREAAIQAMQRMLGATCQFSWILEEDEWA